MINKIILNKEKEFLINLKDFNYLIYSDIEPNNKTKYIYSDSKISVIVTSGMIDLTIIENKPILYKNIFFLKENEHIDIKENTIFNISNLYDKSCNYIKLVNSTYNIIDFEEEDFFNGRMRSFLDGES
jgi:hypothetical protein